MIKHFLVIALFLIGNFTFAQIIDIEENDNEVYSKEAPAELEMSNKGVFVNTSLGLGGSYRISNGGGIKSGPAFSIPIVANVEVGMGRNFRMGAVFERNGNRVNSLDSLKIYAINYGITMALRFGNTSNSYFYVRGTGGFSDLQISGVAFYYGNIQDSLVLTSKNGVFLNLALGQIINLQEGVSCFYQAKIGYMAYPELLETNFITNKQRTLPSDKPTIPLKLKYSQVYIEFGFAFKI